MKSRILSLTLRKTSSRGVERETYLPVVGVCPLYINEDSLGHRSLDSRRNIMTRMLVKDEQQKRGRKRGIHLAIGWSLGLIYLDPIGLIFSIELLKTRPPRHLALYQLQSTVEFAPMYRPACYSWPASLEVSANGNTSSGHPAPLSTSGADPHRTPVAVSAMFGVKGRPCK